MVIHKNRGCKRLQFTLLQNGCTYRKMLFFFPFLVSKLTSAKREWVLFCSKHAQRLCIVGNASIPQPTSAGLCLGPRAPSRISRVRNLLHPQFGSYVADHGVPTAWSFLASHFKIKPPKNGYDFFLPFNASLSYWLEGKLHVSTTLTVHGHCYFDNNISIFNSCL